MEVYSDSGEYIETVKGMMVREVADIKLYLLQYSYEQAVPSCCLKVRWDLVRCLLN